MMGFLGLFKRKNVEDWLEEGDRYIGEGEVVQALNCYVKALRFSSENTEALFNIGLIQAEAGHFQAALGYFDKLVELEPNSQKGWNNRAICLDHLGQHTEALKSFDKAIAIDSAYILAWLGKGDTLAGLVMKPEVEMDKDGGGWVVKQEDKATWKLALECYDQALQIDSDSVPALFGKTRALLGLDRKQEAKLCLTHLKKQVGNDQGVHLLEAMIG